MTDPLGTWAVQYDNTEWMHQNDATRAEFDQASQEIAFRKIDWSRVTAVRFETDLVQTEFAIVPPPAGMTLSMRRRVYTTHIEVSATPDAPGRSESVVTQAYLILRHSSTVDVNDAAALAATVDEVTYWFPTGVVYQCAELNSGAAAQYAQDLAKCVVLETPIPSLPAATPTPHMAATALLA